MNDHFDEQLRRRLAGADAPPVFPRNRIRARVRRTLDAPDRPASRSRWAASALWVRAGATAAAAVLVFVAGVQTGRRFEESAQPGRADAARVGQASPPATATVSMSIQQRGTAYLTEVARLSETADSLSPEQLEEARQVAAAILYGVALELLRTAPDDQLAADIARSLRAQRQGTEGERWY